MSSKEEDDMRLIDDMIKEDLFSDRYYYEPTMEGRNFTMRLNKNLENVGRDRLIYNDDSKVLKTLGPKRPNDHGELKILKDQNFLHIR